MNKSFLRSFRLVCSPEQYSLVEALLEAQGFLFEPEPFHPAIKKLLVEPFPLGSSLAAKFGYIYIQDRSSMLPPLVLNPQQGEAVLDMCASPGSKTGFLAQLVGKNGFVLGNEPIRTRLGTLRSNLTTMNFFQTGTCSFDGENIKLPNAGEHYVTFDRQENTKLSGWNNILLDPPCSGWGTVEKNPQVMQLWQGDKVLPLIALQRELLREATRLLAPGGRIVYSTCTTNIAENEEQLNFAVKELGLTFIPVEAIPGFSFDDSALPEFSGCLRIATGKDGQGFFIGLLEKPLSYPLKNFDKPLFKKKHTQPLSTMSSHSIEDNPLVSSSQLPKGLIASFTKTVHFLPETGLNILPEGFSWKGFLIGKYLSNGRVKVNPFLHDLMHSYEHASNHGLSAINLDETKPFEKLVTGQGLTVSTKEKELGLYFKNLPLCRLSVKGNRALLPLV